MGRRTWDSLKRPLKGRLNVVLSRSAGAVWLEARAEARAEAQTIVQVEAQATGREKTHEEAREEERRRGVIVLPDKRSVLALAPYLSCHLYIIGGVQIYEAFQPEIEQWVVTEIPLSVEGADTFMPADFLRDFRPRRMHTLADDLQVTFYEKT
jgi:dihydrofolate reductase